MNYPIAITDATAKDILTIWQSVLLRKEIQAHVVQSNEHTQLFVPESKIVEARMALFNRP